MYYFSGLQLGTSLLTRLRTDFLLFVSESLQTTPLLSNAEKNPATSAAKLSSALNLFEAPVRTGPGAVWPDFGAFMHLYEVEKSAELVALLPLSSFPLNPGGDGLPRSITISPFLPSLPCSLSLSFSVFFFLEDSWASLEPAFLRLQFLRKKDGRTGPCSFGRSVSVSQCGQTGIKSWSYIIHAVNVISQYIYNVAPR